MPTYTNIYAHIPYSYLDGVLDGPPRWGSTIKTANPCFRPSDRLCPSPGQIQPLGDYYPTQSTDGTAHSMDL